LLLEEAQRVMKILGEDPPLNPLIEPLRITLDNTSNLEEELNGSKTISLEETIDQGSPGTMSPHVGSPVTNAAQQGTIGALGEASILTILTDLITIYDDEEGS
jgi:hypothetical protein